MIIIIQPWEIKNTTHKMNGRNGKKFMIGNTYEKGNIFHIWIY